MIHFEVYKHRNGDWGWEVHDGDELYLRSECLFRSEYAAKDDLKRSCHLIQDLADIA